MYDQKNTLVGRKKSHNLGKNIEIIFRFIFKIRTPGIIYIFIYI